MLGPLWSWQQNQSDFSGVTHAETWELGLAATPQIRICTPDSELGGYALGYRSALPPFICCAFAIEKKGLIEFILCAAVFFADEFLVKY